MKSNTLFPAVLLLAVVLAGCSSGRGDPTSGGANSTLYGGRLTLGADRLNTPVSSDNQLAVAQILNSELYGLSRRALAGISNSPQTVGDSLLTTRVSGRYSGYAEVTGNRQMRESDKQVVDFSFRMTLYDFSDSGFVFMGGELGAEGFVRSAGGQVTQFRLVLTDGLAFAGNYTGAVEYNSMRLPIDAADRITSVYASAGELSYFNIEGSQTLIYGDLRIRFNPYYRSPRP
ncbi:hypothetical protein LLH00_12745 [bacterium]|nr:hypothetical protein [bacterium]